MRSNKYSFFSLLILISFVLSPLTGAAEKESGLNIYHDRKSDTLTLEAKSASLKEVLAKAGVLTGVQILLDKEVDKDISLKLKKEPVESAFKRIIRAAGGLSHAMVFSKGDKKDDKPILISITILPSGKSDRKGLVPAIGFDKEVLLRGNMRPSTKGNADFRGALDNKRWQARLDRLPAKIREKVTERINSIEEKKRLRAAAKKERREKRRAAREKDANKIKERRLKHLERLKESDPEKYQKRLERLERRSERRERSAR